MKSASMSLATLKKIAKSCPSAKDSILAEVPTLFDDDGFLLDITEINKQAALRSLSEDLSEPPPHVGKMQTRLIEPLLKRGSGNENGHGLYLHRRIIDGVEQVSWYVSNTKQNKAIRLVPVASDSPAEAELIKLGYKKI